jgi:hypothetical protein
MKLGDDVSFSITHLFGTFLPVDREDCLYQRFSAVFLVTK